MSVRPSSASSKQGTTKNNNGDAPSPEPDLLMERLATYLESRLGETIAGLVDTRLGERLAPIRAELQQLQADMQQTGEQLKEFRVDVEAKLDHQQAEVLRQTEETKEKLSNFQTEVKQKLVDDILREARRVAVRQHRAMDTLSGKPLFVGREPGPPPSRLGVSSIAGWESPDVPGAVYDPNED